MKTKTQTGLSLTAVAISVLAPIGTKTLDTTQKIVESRLVKSEAKAADESQWSLIAFQDLKDELDALKAEVKQLREK